MKDIIRPLSTRFGLCLSLIFLANLSFAQSQIKDTLIFNKDSTTKIWAKTMNGNVFGPSKIIHEKGYKTGDLAYEVPKNELTKKHTFSYGLQVGFWSYFDNDSILYLKEEIFYNKNFTKVALKVFDIKNNNSIFHTHKVEKYNKLREVEIKYYENGKKKNYYWKSSFWRFYKSYELEVQEDSSILYYLSSKKFGNKYFWKERYYNDSGHLTKKVNYVRNSRDMYVTIYYNYDGKKLNKPFNQFIKYQEKCRFGMWNPNSQKK